RRFALVFPVLVGAYFVLTTFAAENGRHGIHTASVGSLWGGIRNRRPDWIDRAVRSDAHVSFLWHYNAGETRPLWNNEFFNLSVRVGTDAQLFDAVQTLAVTSGGRTTSIRIAPAEQPTAHVRLEPRDGVCTVSFVARIVRVPAQVQKRGTDDRPLAAHYYAFDYRP